MENLPQEQRKQRLIQSKPSEKGEIITYLSRMGDVLEQVPQWCQVIFSVGAVHSVIDCDEANAVLRENHLCVHTDLKIVSAQSRHIFYNDCPDFPGFNIRKHLLEAGTVKR